MKCTENLDSSMNQCSNGTMQNESKESWKQMLPYILILLGIVVVWRLLPLLIPDSIGKEQGWAYGSTLFTALAFGALIITLLLQRKDLKLQCEAFKKTSNSFLQQKEEMAQQKEEMKQQKEEMQQQKKLMADRLQQAGIQQFKSTLFNLLGQYDYVANGILGSTTTAGVTIGDGRNFTNYWANKIKSEKPFNSTEIQFSMANYVNYLFRIFKYIDSEKNLQNEDKAIEFEDRHNYCSFVTNIISFNEMLVLKHYINNINEGYCQEFKELADKYALFENIRLAGADGNLWGESPAFRTEKAKKNFLEKYGQGK